MTISAIQKDSVRNRLRLARLGFGLGFGLRSPRVGEARREWRVANRAWRRHVFEAGVFFPGWAIVLSVLIATWGGAAGMSLVKHWAGWIAVSKGDAPSLWALVCFAAGVLAPIDLLRRGRRISAARRDYAQARDPQWASTAQQLAGRERAAREAMELAAACSQKPQCAPSAVSSPAASAPVSARKSGRSARRI